MNRVRLAFAVSFAIAPAAVAQSDAEPRVRLAEVVVTPSRFGVVEMATSTAASLTAAEIEVLPQLGDDLFRSIARLPGLAADDFSARFWIRGAPQSQLLARLDGVDLVEPFHLKDVDGALSIVDPAIIQRLDLSTGGFTAEFGDRLAGVLTMETKTPARRLTALGLSLTGVGGSHQAGFAGNRGRWLVSVRRGYPDVALRLSDRSNDISPRYHDVFAKAEFDLTPAHTVSVHALHAGDALRYLRRSSPSLTSAYASDYVWGRWRGAVHESLHGEAVASFSRHTWERTGSGRRNSYPFSLDDERRLDVAALRNDWTLGWGERAVFRGGVEAKRAEASYDYALSRSREVVSGGRLVRVDDERQAALRPEGTALGGFLSARVQPLAALVVEPGVRLDRSDWARPPGGTEAKTIASPRLNAVWNVGRAIVRAAWGDHAQAKGLHELQFADGDRSFGRPERAEHRVVGLEYPLTQTIAFRVEAYARRHTRIAPRWENLDNPYDLFPEVQSDRVSLGPERGRARGVEVLLSSRGAAALTWRASYVASRAEERISGRWVPRARDQRHAIYADATYVLNRRWQFSAAWQFHSGWPTTDIVSSLTTLANGRRVVSEANGAIYGLRVPDYHRLDLRATRRFALRRGELRVFVDVFNAYDRRNVLGYDHDVTVSGSEVTDVKEPREQLPLLPSVGLAWEF